MTYAAEDRASIKARTYQMWPIITPEEDMLMFRLLLNRPRRIRGAEMQNNFKSYSTRKQQPKELSIQR